MNCCLAEPFPVYVWRVGCLNFAGNGTEFIHKGYGGLISCSFSVSSSFALARISSTSFLVRARDSPSPLFASSFRGTSELGLGDLKKTHVTLQLADASIRYSKGVVEDVLIKVKDFVFSINFIVLDTKYTFEAEPTCTMIQWVCS